MKVECSFMDMRDVSIMVPHPRNPNKHPDSQIELLAKIMKHQGWRHPIIVSDRSGFIVSGHGRLMAAKLNGWTQCPVDVQHFENEADEYAHMVADNKIAELAETDMSMVNTDVMDLGPDFDIDLLGIPGFEIELADKLDPQCDEDEVPEAPAIPKTVLGDIYELGRHRLMCGDSTSGSDVDKLFDGKSAELCFTSPPYADQREYNGGKELSTEHLATFIRTAFGKVNYFVVNLGYARKSGEVNQYWNDYITEAKNCGLKFLSWNIWDKGQAGSIGNQTAMFAISHEWIFVFGNDLKEINRTQKNIRSGETMDRAVRRSDGTMYYSGDKFEVGDLSQMKTVLNMFPQKDRSHGIDHPAMFPVGLPCSHIEAMTEPGQVVYEPFGGSGTTMVASEKTGRKSFLMELDPKYCDVIVSRYVKYTGNNNIKLNGQEIEWNG
jgi:DNA modification methylase